MKFIANNSSHSTLHTDYKEKYTEEMKNIIFLGLQINNHLNWKNHIEQIIPQSTEVHYAVRLMVHINVINTVKSIYYA
jgi:hypothetical protein